MSRAKQKGTAFERAVADYLKQAMNDDRIDRAPLAGAKDKGDISGVVSPFGRIVLELKNHNRQELAVWVDEAETERGNADALVGVVVHKRRGKGWPGDQYVTLTLDGLVKLLGGPIGGPHADL
jgi:Holliday junction resolvase